MEANNMEANNMEVNDMEVNDMEVNDILAEMKAEEFIEKFIAEADAEVEENKIVEEKKEVKMGNKKNEAKAFEKQKQNKMDKETRNYFAKNIALMVATAVCGYFKLATPILCIVIGIICACAFSYKCGEVKGRAKGRAKGRMSNE